MVHLKNFIQLIWIKVGKIFWFNNLLLQGASRSLDNWRQSSWWLAKYQEMIYFSHKYYTNFRLNCIISPNNRPVLFSLFSLFWNPGHVYFVHTSIASVHAHTSGLFSFVILVRVYFHWHFLSALNVVYFHWQKCSLFTPDCGLDSPLCSLAETRLRSVLWGSARNMGR